MKYWWNSFKNLPKFKKFLVVLALIVFLGLMVAAGFWFAESKFIKDLQRVFSPQGTLITEDPPETKSIAHPITGVLYTPTEAKAWNSRVPLAIMVENSVAARPHRGISKADIVYEALAEGSITRFVTLFSTNSTQVGPARSARSYYMDWALEYKAAYAHWGGNEYVRSQALQVFGKKDFDQFAIGSAAFYRLPPGSRSEHSGFTHTAKLWNIASQRGVNKLESFDTWKFKDDTPKETPTHPVVNIGFKGNYSVRWNYDKATNSYKRFNGGVAHMDREHNVQISAKNIVAIFLQGGGLTQVTPNVYNRDYKTVGSGKARVYLDGGSIDATWKKDSKSGRTKIFDKNGKEIEFNRGQFWMEMVPVGTSVS